jgi:hypothetical protein
MRVRAPGANRPSASKPAARARPVAPAGERVPSAGAPTAPAPGAAHAATRPGTGAMPLFSAKKGDGDGARGSSVVTRATTVRRRPPPAARRLPPPPRAEPAAAAPAPRPAPPPLPPPPPQKEPMTQAEIEDLVLKLNEIEVGGGVAEARGVWGALGRRAQVAAARTPAAGASPPPRRGPGHPGRPASPLTSPQKTRPSSLASSSSRAGCCPPCTSTCASSCPTPTCWSRWGDLWGQGTGWTGRAGRRGPGPEWPRVEGGLSCSGRGAGLENHPPLSKLAHLPPTPQPPRCPA